MRLKSTSEEKIRKIERVMKENFERLKKYVNVLSFSISGTKWRGGKDTGISCITVFVKKKVPELDEEGNRLLAVKDVLPTEIEGVLIDVVELSTEDWKLGDTSKSVLSPLEQRKLAGVIKDEG